jgi:hypothetical protein
MRTTTVPLGEIRQNQLGVRIAARLSTGTADLPHDIQERLRAAREQALIKRKRATVKVAVPVLSPNMAGGAISLSSGSSASMTLGGMPGLAGGLAFGSVNPNNATGSQNDDNVSRWSQLISITVAVALVIGLVTIDVLQDDADATEVANVDTALLTDPLPPQAYTDQGFAQFLKTGVPPTDQVRGVSPAR